MGLGKRMHAGLVALSWSGRAIPGAARGSLRQGGGRSAALRRLTTAAFALSLATAGLIGSPRPAAAVHAVPWRFTTVVENSTISGTSTKGWVLPCPAGYTPVSGGVVAGDEVWGFWRILEWADQYDGAYHIMVYNDNFNGTTVTLAATCVWLDDVGTITTVSADFARNGSGRAGGSLHCPDGTTVLSAAVDWSYYSAGRTINYSTPITDGTQYGTGWYVAGYSEHAGATLGIELRCVDAGLLTTEYATAEDSTAGPGYFPAKAVCATGYRILTGGAAPPADQLNPGIDQGWAVSGPLDARQWPAFGHEEQSGVSLRALALCVPASTVSVGFTQTPPALSNSRSGTITFGATDSAGENLAVKCYLDAVQWLLCQSGDPFAFSSLSDGWHTFYVSALNQSGSFGSNTFNWQVDATAPLISSHSPTSGASLTGPVTINFSEPVAGVTTSSVIVHAESANVDVAGTIASSTASSFTWTPKSRLVPGETYRFSFTTAIHDIAGNPLTATYFNVRATTVVDNTSAALLEYWDLDNSTLASGGAFISSSLSGSRADLTFTATAGQTVSVYGIRVGSGGYADIYIDGIKKATASFYASTNARARVYLSGALTAGTHIISIRPLGTKPSASTGTWVDVDNLLIGATVKQESSLKQLFRRTTNASAYGGSYDVMFHKTDADAAPRYQATVVGTGFKVYVTKTSSSGAAKVYVDGVLKATISTYSATTVYNSLVYTGTFTLGQHSITIVAVGSSTGNASYIDLDRMSVT
jgi:hypothetical protein